MKGTMLDATFDFLLKSFKVRSTELAAADALKHAAELRRYFAVELTYKGELVRLIVAASNVTREFSKTAITRAVEDGSAHLQGDGQQRAGSEGTGTPRNDAHGSAELARP